MFGDAALLVTRFVDRDRSGPVGTLAPRAGERDWFHDTLETKAR